MIKSAMVAMVVLGCDCDAKMCEFIRETPAQWSTVAECEAALRHQTLTSGQISYPLVTGVCRDTTPVAPKVAQQSAPQPTLVSVPVEPVRAEPAIYSGVVQGSRAIFRRTANGYVMVRDTLGTAATGTAAVARRASDRIVSALSF